MSANEAHKVAEIHGVGTIWTITTTDAAPHLFDVFVASGPSYTQQSTGLSWLAAIGFVGDAVQQEMDAETSAPIGPPRPDNNV